MYPLVQEQLESYASNQPSSDWILGLLHNMEPVTCTIIKESIARWVISPSGKPITLLKGHIIKQTPNDLL